MEVLGRGDLLRVSEVCLKKFQEGLGLGGSDVTALKMTIGGRRPDGGRNVNFTRRLYGFQHLVVSSVGESGYFCRAIEAYGERLVAGVGAQDQVVGLLRLC